MSISKGQLAKLTIIVKATQSPAGFTHMTEKSVKVLVDAGLAECNVNDVSADGVAVRATQPGVDMINAPQAQGTEPVATSAFEILSNRPIPAITRVGAAAKYPFAQLELGQSFFVPATEAQPAPHKSMASTVATAAKRFGRVVGTRTISRKVDGVMTEVQVDRWGYSRKFMARRSELNGVPGAEVFRIEVPANEVLPND